MMRARYRRITTFFARVIISVIFWDLILPRVGLRAISNRNRAERMRRYAASFRSMAVKMGGVMIKVGQFFSSRVDVLPPEIIQEIKGLQDEVPAEDFKDIRRVAEAELGAPLEEKFAAFERHPLAAASLGQVHRARLHPGDQTEIKASGRQAFIPNDGFNVVVKIQRPKIEQIIQTDLAALHTVGKWLHRYRPIRKRADVPTLLQEFDRILFEEIDYLAEGRNAETFNENFQGHPGVRVPRVIWTHTTRRALTLENVYSIKITDYESITKAGISRTEVAARLLDTYLKQIFEDGFFHADPHPGNLFINPLGLPTSGSARRWELTFVDFGMVGKVPGNLRAGLRELLVGLGTQETARVIRAYEMMDMLLPGADIELLERAVSREFDLFWGKSMSELNTIDFNEVRRFAEEFQELLFDLPFQVPQNMVFLARCVGILAGMCTGLDPSFNLFDHLVPYAQKIIAEETRYGYEYWIQEAQKLGRSVISLPYKMENALSKISRDRLVVRTPEVDRQLRRLESALRKVSSSILFAALLLGAIQLYLGDKYVLAIVLISAAGLNLLWLLFGGRNQNER